MVLLLPVINKLISVLLPYSIVWLLLLPAYSVWLILSAPLFYKYRKNKGVEKGFITYYCMNAQWSTFWVDIEHAGLYIQNQRAGRLSEKHRDLWI